ncbi:MAG TPA: EamA family transporter, partial [Chthonomonadaceae bacterium]|nr:EamA family transporter [Chthonomonadaceae bacterium]
AEHMRGRWRESLAAGGCSIAAYALALWAMTRAQIAAVAALRETSIVFGVAIAGLLLKERIGPLRAAAAVAVVAGAIAIRMG